MTDHHRPPLVIDGDAQPSPVARFLQPAQHRNPYVGDGVDGCLRSADIDRAEADTHPTASPAWDRCSASAYRWEMQARDLGWTG